MLQFPDNYFKKELKDGFVVGEVMKRSWACSLEVLQRIIDVCERHHFTYVVYWGSLLGAVRHKGFIPWDDDIDIALAGEDYVDFLSIAEQELPKEYCILNVYTEDGYTNDFTRITNGRTVDTGERRMNEYHGCPLALGVDVFPLYYLPRDEQCAEMQKMLLIAIGQLDEMLDCRKQKEAEGADRAAIQKYNEEIAKRLIDLRNVTGFQFEGGRNLKTQLMMLYDQVCRLYSAEESDYITSFPVYMMKNSHYISKDYLRDNIMAPFENIMVRIPRAYDEILTKTYGNYMIPKKNSGGHEYIYFKRQLECLLQETGMCGLHYDVCEMQREEKAELPENWGQKAYAINEKGQSARKKMVLYSITWEEIFCNSGNAIEKLRYVLDTFKENREVVLWWFAYPLTNEADKVFRRIMPDLIDEYMEIVKDYQEADWGIYDDSLDVFRAIELCDAYYGDEGELYNYFKETGKFMMCQNYEILA